MTVALPMFPCSKRPSGRTSSAWWRPGRTPTRWSRWPPGGTGPMPALNDEVDAVARGLMALGVRQGRSRRHLGAQLCRMGDASARDGQDRRDPGQHQPGVPHPRTGIRTQAIRHSTLVSATAFKSSDYVTMVAEVQADCPALERHHLPRHPGLGPVAHRAGRRGSIAGADRPSCPTPTRSTSSTPRGQQDSPRGRRSSHRNILNNGFFVGGLINFDRGDRVCIPVPFYHCFGMVMGNLGALTHGATIVIPAPGFDPGDHAGRGRIRAVHRAVRGADDVHRDARAIPTSRNSTCPHCGPGSWRARCARSR